MTNYSRGADFERAVKADLEGKGWFVVRSAGSHGAVDLVAIGEGGVIRFIQAKINGKMSWKDREEITELAAEYGAEAIMASRPRRGMIDYEVIEP